MHDKIFELLMDKDEITWQNLLYELIKTEQMDPWDIDISLLSQRFLEKIKALQEMNFFLSGKVILASALLLKIKSDKLLTENIAGFDDMLFDRQEEVDLFEEQNKHIAMIENPILTIKTPQTRKRKVTLEDLFAALQKALEVDERRTLRKLKEKELLHPPEIPEKKIDITQKIKEIYTKILDFLKIKKDVVTFTELVGSHKREEKIYTFIPLLHLHNDEKIFLRQDIPFGEIYISKLEK